MAQTRIGLRQQAAGGIRWTGMATGSNAALTFVQTAVLAHFLSPSDFGVGSMVTVIVAFTQLFSDAGVSSALIYRQNPTERELSSLYWLNVLTGVVMCAVINAAVDAAVWFFDEPRVAGPLRVASLVFLIVPLGQQFQFLLQKELQFRPLATTSISGYVAGAVVAIASAAWGAGVYALVFGQLANAAVRTVLFVRGRWHARPQMHFDRRDLRGYVGFGLYQTGDRAANFFNSYLLHGLIGSMLGARVLGIYTLAFELAFKPLDSITPIVTRVAFPVLASIREDLARVRRGYLAMLRLLSTVNFPLALATAAIAPVVVPAIYGEQWRPAIPLVEVLSVVALLRSSGSPVGSLLLGMGKANWGFWWSLGKTLVQLPVLYVGILTDATQGAAIAYLLIQALYTAVSYPLLIRRLLGPCLVEYVRNFLPALAVALAVAVSIRVAMPLFTTLSPAIQMLALLPVMGLTYVGSAMLFARSTVAEVLPMIGSRK
jgi:O-antigen/teichoic acid export membrane protein